MVFAFGKNASSVSHPYLDMKTCVATRELCVFRCAASLRLHTFFIFRHGSNALTQCKKYKKEMRSKKMKKALSLLFALSMALVLCACGQTEAAKHADETIAAIGQVTESSLRQIEKAEEEVTSLSEKEAKSLRNLDALREARSEYNELLAAKLEEQISILSELDFYSGDTITQIREEYETMSDEVKSLVSNYDVLEKAEAALPAIRADVVTDEIANALAMEIETAEDIRVFDTAAVSVQEKYNELDDAEKSMVVDYDKFEKKVKDANIALAKLSLKDVKIWAKQIYSHLEVYINFKNSSEKTIKYISWGVMFQNPVGDYMAYQGDPIYLCDETGPYETGKGYTGSNDCWTFYSSKVNSCSARFCQD